MLQINFEKAYDRVDHMYIWEVMEELGFTDMYIKLAWGLVEGGTAKFHFDGLFTDRIPLARGGSRMPIGIMVVYYDNAAFYEDVER
jgi:beta-galactosidase GanA